MLLPRVVVEEAEFASLEAALDLALVGQASGSIVFHCPFLEGRVYNRVTPQQGPRHQLAGRCGDGPTQLDAVLASTPQLGGAGQGGQGGLPGLWGGEPPQWEAARGVRDSGELGGVLLFWE